MIDEIRKAGEEMCDDFERRKGRTKAARRSEGRTKPQFGEPTSDFTCIHDVLKALADAIETSDPSKREALAAALDGYAESSPEDFYWSVGVQAPSLLNQLVMTIDMSCRPDAQPDNPRIRLEDHKPQGNA